MIGYATLGSNDPACAHVLYDAVFGSVGIGRIMTLRNGTVTWRRSWDQPMIAVGMPHDGGTAAAGNGTMRTVVMDSRAKVDTMHAAAIATGCADEAVPGIRGVDRPQALYGACFRDPDGNKLCAFRVGPA